MTETYQTISAANQAEFKDKGSRFIAFAYPINSTEAVKNHLDALRQTHHKARHCCYAYRLGIDGTQFRANDDGEPAGSAGRPILGQIDSANLTDVLVVVVRYFGGTLLGVSGLIHAYKTSTAMALQTADVIQKNIEKTLFLRCDYPHLPEVLRLAKIHHASIITQDLQLDCRLSIRVPLSNYTAAITAWQQLRVVELAEQPFQAA